MPGVAWYYCSMIWSPSIMTSFSCTSFTETKYCDWAVMYMCIRDSNFDSFYEFLMDFWTVPTVWYFLFFIILYWNVKYSQKYYLNKIEFVYVCTQWPSIQWQWQCISITGSTENFINFVTPIVAALPMYHMYTMALHTIAYVCTQWPSIQYVIELS